MPIDHLTPTIVDVYHWSAWDVKGQAEYGGHERARARVEWVDVEIRTQVGQMQSKQLVKIDAKAWFQPDVNVNDNDRAVVEGVSYRVVKKEEPKDAVGRIDHIEVALSEEN